MDRLFVAAWPPAETVTRLASLLPGGGGGPGGAVDRLHVTLRFLGDAPADEAASRLAAAALPRATAVLGPSVRVLGRGAVVVPVAGLDTLAAAVAEATSGIGATERGPFQGHVTLARVRRGRRPAEGMVGAEVDGTFDVHEVTLVRSRLGGGPPVYDVIGRWPTVASTT